MRLSTAATARPLLQPSHLLAVSLLVLSSFPSALAQSAATSSSKRGLIYVPNKKHPSDDSTWVSPASDLTWYYTYQQTPAATYTASGNTSATGFEFVPMLWGAPASAADTSFLDGVTAMIDDPAATNGGAPVSHVLAFNEPDGSADTGGSAVSPQLAAQTWIRELEPLRALGVRLGAPATTGAPEGFTWLQDFFDACAGGCTVDFMTAHWYGNFEGMASHIGQKRAAYPNLTMWVTEYAYPDADLADTQAFYNQSASFLDSLDYVARYAYFGAFRSSVSNVGADAAMLDQKGRLTDLGAWYLGGGEAAAGSVPSDGVTISIGGAWALLVVGACFCVL